jgi:hypothetical protein
MPDEVPGHPLLPLEVAKERAEKGEYAGAQAWALIAIGDELKAIRREQYRQARGSRG